MKLESNDETMRRVANLGKVPEGFSFDKKKVWKKLEHCLQQNLEKRRKKRILIAICAFIFLAGAFITSLIISGDGNTIKQDKEKPTFSSKIFLKQDSASAQTLPGPQPQNEKKIVRVKHDIPDLSNDKTDSAGPALAVNPSIDTVELVKQEPVAKKDSIGLVVARSKLRFPVSHINTINQPAYPDWPPDNKPIWTSNQKNPYQLYDERSGIDQKIDTKKKPKSLLSLFSSTQ
jgi:hypothetical protein